MGGKPGILHGNKTYLLQSNDGQIDEAHSISAGLDYPGIGPEHSIFEQKRVQYMSATDKEAIEAFQYCCNLRNYTCTRTIACSCSIKKIAKNTAKKKLLL